MDLWTQLTLSHWSSHDDVGSFLAMSHWTDPAWNFGQRALWRKAAVDDAPAAPRCSQRSRAILSRHSGETKGEPEDAEQWSCLRGDLARKR